MYNQKGQEAGKVNLPDRVFGLKANDDLVYQVATSQMSNRRQVIAHAKTRAEVRGGGKKPWRQKGTGRARHGSIRSPIWKGGGVTGGPTKDRNFKKKINRKMANKAVLVTLSSKVKSKNLLVLDGISLENGKTKEMASVYKNINKVFGEKKSSSTLLVLPALDKKVTLSARNLQNLSTIEARNLNVLDVLAHKNLVVLNDSIEVIEKSIK